MDSRIILKRADFSQNNIGRYVELNALTKNILAKQTQYDESSSEATALNDFVEYLIDNNYIGGDSPKFKVLIIPALAKTHDELLFNIADTDSNGYPVNVMSQTEISATDKIFTLVKDANNRVVGLSTQVPAGINSNTDYEAAGAAISFTDSGAVASQSTPGRSLFVYSTKSLSVSYTDLIVSYASICSFYSSYIGLNYQTRTFGYVLDSVQGFIGVSYNNSINTLEATVDEDITLTMLETGVIPCLPDSEPSQSYNKKLPTNFTPKLSLAPYVNAGSRHAAWSIMGVSDYISPSDMEDLMDKVGTLMSALHVVI